MSTFPDVKKKLGFGCMRLPMDGEKVDYAEFTKMVDEFMAQGFNYFDTARVYIGGQGETAIRDCVVKRYPRDSFILTDKLSDSLFNSEDEIRPLFEKQLESCGVDYFDFYLLHSQTKAIFEKYKKLHAYEHAFELKKEGKVKLPTHKDNISNYRSSSIEKATDSELFRVSGFSLKTRLHSGTIYVYKRNFP